jgi:hypothetical protein
MIANRCSNWRTTAYAAWLALAILAGCAQAPLRGPVIPPPEPPAQAQVPPAPPKVEAPQPKPAPVRLYEWHVKDAKVSHIEIDVDAQIARFYSGGEEVGWSTVASGIATFPTPTGEFAVIEKVAAKRSNLYGKIYDANGKLVNSDARYGRDRIPPGGRFVGASMPYFMRLTYDVLGLHAGPIPRPGSPASHGCIRLPKRLAPVLFRNTTLGTPVRIIGSTPGYGGYIAVDPPAPPGGAG